MWLKDKFVAFQENSRCYHYSHDEKIPNRRASFNFESVVNENLQVRGATGLYVCDMSVIPISTAANPVRTLAALALRLSHHLG